MYSEFRNSNDKSNKEKKHGPEAVHALSGPAYKEIRCPRCLAKLSYTNLGIQTEKQRNGDSINYINCAVCHSQIYVDRITLGDINREEADSCPLGKSSETLGIN